MGPWWFWNKWNFVPETKGAALANTALRVLLAPLSILIELLHISGRLIDDEEESSTGFKHRTENGHVSENGHTEGNQRVQPVRKRLLRVPWLYKKRLRLCWEDSGTLLIQSTLYFLLLEVLATFGIQHLLRLFRDDIERWQAAVTGNWYITKEGENFALSPSSGDAQHLIHGHCLGKLCSLCSRRNVDCPFRVSFMAACCKLSYEAKPVIKDVVVNRWGLKLTSYGNVPANIHLGHNYTPDMVWVSASSSQGLVIAFTGAQVWLKVDRQTDILTALVSVPGCGRMMRGFVEGLEKYSPESKATVYDTLKRLIEDAPPAAEIFLTGHSLGGGSAVVFAMLLAQRDPLLAAKVTGIFTFGAPRIGDADFAAHTARVYGGRLFRYVYAADMVSKLPHAVHGVPFVHHAGLRFITSAFRFYKEEDDPALTTQLLHREDRWAYALNAKKILQLLHQAQFDAALGRLLLFALPGFSDHFLKEYQKAIDRDLLQSSHAAQVL